MPIEFTDDERAALIDLLVGTIEHDLFRQSPRIQRLRAILAKLRRCRNCRARKKRRASGETQNSREPRHQENGASMRYAIKPTRPRTRRESSHSR